MGKKGARRRQKAGLPPGSLLHIGAERTAPVRLSLIRYDEKSLQESQLASIAECPAPSEAAGVTWLNLDGVHDVEVVAAFGGRFALHPLVLEDIANTAQRPKLEQYDDTLFLVTKMLTWDEAVAAIRVEQVSFVLRKNLLLSFQEQPGDVFDLIRQRIRQNKGRIRAAGADYLLYCLLDAMVDYYFVVLEAMGECIEGIHEAEIAAPDPQTPRRIHNLKRQMVTLRRSVWPLREVMSAITREGGPHVQAETLLYLRDLHDHTIRVIDTAETYRDMLSSVLEVYLSSVSNRMNEVMKVLTIIATIFIPLTFIAGVYGMNFKNMPEMDWRYGYPVALAAMLIVAGLMLVFFRRKRWL